MTSDLITWLRAQLDDDERVARTALDRHPAPWVGAFKQVTSEPNGGVIAPVASTETRQASHHIARWDPARVLAEVDAKRRVLDLRDSEYDEHRAALNGAVRLLALPYADRDGYREEWRP
jgi:hypothetical protein